MMEDLVTVTKIEFLESHVPYHAAVFHYIVLVYLKVRRRRKIKTLLKFILSFMENLQTLQSC